MKKLLTILLLLPVFAMAQPSSGSYPKIDQGLNVLRGYFRALTIPGGAAPTLQTGQWPGSGALWMDSIHRRVYYRWNNNWYALVDTTMGGSARQGLTNTAGFSELGSNTQNAAVFTNDRYINTNGKELYLESRKARIRFMADSAQESGLAQIQLKGPSGGFIELVADTTFDSFRTYPGIYWTKNEVPMAVLAHDEGPTGTNHVAIDIYGDPGAGSFNIENAGTPNATFLFNGNITMATQGAKRLGLGSYTMPSHTLDVRGSIMGRDTIYNTKTVSGSYPEMRNRLWHYDDGTYQTGVFEMRAKNGGLVQFKILDSAGASVSFPGMNFVSGYGEVPQATIGMRYGAGSDKDLHIDLLGTDLFTLRGGGNVHHQFWRTGEINFLGDGIKRALFGAFGTHATIEAGVEIRSLSFQTNDSVRHKNIPLTTEDSSGYYVLVIDRTDGQLKAQYSGGVGGGGGPGGTPTLDQVLAEGGNITGDYTVDGDGNDITWGDFLNFNIDADSLRFQSIPAINDISALKFLTIHPVHKTVSYSSLPMTGRGSYYYTNDFMSFNITVTGTDGTLISLANGTSANAMSDASPNANRPGEMRLNAGTTNTGRSALQTSSTAVNFGGGTWIFETDLETSALSDGTDDYAVLAGFMDVFTGVNQVDGIYFLYDSAGTSTGSASSDKWQIVTVQNSTRTFTTTTVTVAASTFYRLRAEVNAAASSVEFFINGTSVGTHSANIPSGSTKTTGFGSAIYKSSGTNSRWIDMDFMEVQSQFTTAR